MIGTVYKIEIGEKIYIGSTIQKLCKRQSLHNFILRENKQTYKLYEECRINNIKKIICIPLETKEIEDDLEIRLLEQEYIDKLKPTINSQLAYTGLTREEYIKDYYINNKEKLTEKSKEYYEKNKQTVLEKQRKYGKEHNEKSKERNKIYRNNNKDKVKEYFTDYYKKNKDKVLEKVKCDICNSIVNKGSLKRHQKRNICLSYK